MKFLSAFCGAVLALAGLTAQAQNDDPAVPVEVFICNYNEGMDMDDLDRAFDNFNRWADREGITDLTALTLTPNFHNDELTADVIGMDIWGSGAAMGAGLAAIAADPDSVSDFDEVVECRAHQMFALVGIKPPVGDVTSGILEFTNCTVHEGRTGDDGIAAATEVVNGWTPWGIGDAHAVLFNVAGEALDATYTFKWITYYPTVEAFGEVFDHYAGGFVQQAQATINPVMACDSSRVYNMEVARSSEDEEG